METNREKWTKRYCIHYHLDTDTVESCFSSLSTILIFLNFMKAFFYLINSHFVDIWISTDFLKKCYYVLILFFISTSFRDTSFDAWKVALVCLYTCCQFSIFPNKSVSGCCIKLKTGMLYHINNTFWNTVV